jgi:hypothetical protein
MTLTKAKVANRINTWEMILHHQDGKLMFTFNDNEGTISNGPLTQIDIDLVNMLKGIEKNYWYYVDTPQETQDKISQLIMAELI